MQDEIIQTTSVYNVRDGTRCFHIREICYAHKIPLIFCFKSTLKLP